MGTAQFGIPSIQLLLDNQYPIVSVVTVPDKPAGRGQKVQMSPIKKFALEHHLPILQPEKLRESTFLEQLRALQPDLFVVVAFRILPPEMFTIPKFGAFNLHASLLPKYRGAAPIQWTIINGEKETGVTTFFLQETVDTGNIILQARLPIHENETAGVLHDRLAEVGAEIVLHSVRLIEQGKVALQPQDEKMATLAPKIYKEHCKIDWTKSAQQIHNLIRGLSPKPGAFTTHKGTQLKLYRSLITQNKSSQPSGTVVQADKQLLISTGDSALEILELQQQGKNKLSAVDFLRGYRIRVGDGLE
jgi:methionyl-tRNA formyltransferase